VPSFQPSVLEDFAKALLQAGGCDPTGAAVVANSLVAANLAGHDSHGVMRIPFYLTRIQDGGLDPTRPLLVEHETASSVVADGQWGLGQVVAHDLLNRLMIKCQSSAIAAGTLKRSTHIGRLGEYAETAAARGLISLTMVNNHGAGQRVSPVGGKRPRLGTNPICIGVPGGEHGPFICDIGTSATAEGKVRVKKLAGQPVPAGWLLDPDGQPTTDPNQLYGDPPGTILPLGGDQAYKGFGLAFMIELLCGGLSGGPTAFPNPPPPLGNCVLMVVINPALFAGTSHLLEEAKQLENYVRSVPLIEGVASVYLPGDPERNTRQQRINQGIWLDDGNWKALTDLAAKLSVTPPQGQGGSAI
jgi:hydroxycarboxylate dehydrogenase B